MANKAKLFERQKELGDELVTIRTKLSLKTIRVTRMPEVSKRIEQIQAEFEANNAKLLAQGITSEDYFEQKYFESIEDVISNNFELIQQIIKEEELGKQKEEVNQEKQQAKQAPTTHQSILSIGDETKNKDIVIDQEEVEELRQEFIEKVEWMRRKMSELPTIVDNASNELLEIKTQQIKKRFIALEDVYKKLCWFKSAKNERILKEEIEDDYYGALALLAESVKSSSTKPTQEPIKDASGYSNLGKIEIPEFHGDINNWASFHDMFKSLVHDCNHLSNVEKMYRLVTALKGEAKKLVQHLKVTDVNYIAAFEILKQRYENRRLLFTSQVDKLLDQPTVNSESSSSVKQLLDTTNSCIYALKGMDVTITDAEPFIARIIIRKLDNDGLRYYEQNVKKTKEIQSLDDVLSFLEQQVQALEAVTKRQGNKFQKKLGDNFKVSNTLYSTQQTCLYCNMNGHLTSTCRKFLALPVTERRKIAYKDKLCFTCVNHKFDRKCLNKTKCGLCGKGHHKLLHINEAKNEEPKPGTSKAMMTKETTTTTTTTLLATAQVKVRAANGELVTLRALIDQGSQITGLSEEAYQILALPKIKCKTNIQGLGNKIVATSQAKVELHIQPRCLSNQVIVTDAIILPSISGPQPDQSFKIDLSQWDNYVLADPRYNKSDRIDILIGADLFGNILEEGVCKRNGLVAQSTKLGWILSGVYKSNSNNKKLSAVTNLERFWELEELPNTEECSEDKDCLEMYEKTTRINKDGQIVVKLPLKDDVKLGDSRKQALARFLSLEKRLDRNITLRNDYVRFMQEYLDLGHMTEVEESYTGQYYLPHQPVIRESSLTTKLRVVFDASAKTSNGNSLNDIMYTGPKLQKDIFDIIVKWRLWKYVVTADVEKMYRQVKITENDQSYQHILWRENKKESIKEYKLNTVTYGTASAPFLAVRSLFYIADSCSEDDLFIRNIIKEDFYMDDLMTGSDTIQQCKIIQHKIENQLRKFGFHLRKWLSNNKQVTADIKNIQKNAVIKIEDDESVKTLGLQWDPVKDEFMFNINFMQKDKITKRQALSDVARIFDPLGWLSPVTLIAKLFIQKLWLQQSTWDEVLSDELKEEWDEFTKNIISLQQIRIPRWVKSEKDIEIEMHGFADASEKAYAAVVYIKLNASVILLTAKSKVNPIKNKKTLPKLELSAAHLLARLLHRVTDTFKRQHKIYAWSDSTIALGWIHNNKNKDKFIRNRVNEINTLVPGALWQHVSSKDNPADIASRGIYANKFKDYSLWWNGPNWLSKSPEYWPKHKEEQPVTSCFITNPAPKLHFLDKLIGKYSKLNKLLRVVAYVLRFTNIIKGKRENPQYLTVAELEAAEKLIIFHHQQHEFKNEIMSLSQKGLVGSTSKIVSLYPFIDSDNILRVGGRLDNSSLHYNHKHQIILQNSHLASLIIDNVHTLTLHGGNRLVEANIKRKYWIVGAKAAVKKHIRNCTKCVRYRQDAAKQLMGNLPEVRVTPSNPFMHTGVDYAGPIQMKCSKGRGLKSFKGYIAVFVCMVTKAIHLEAVSDLTTEAFLAALKRFFARRGFCSHIYSDNGTNFIGANKKLDAGFKEAIKRNESLIPILATQKIQWHFIPPAAPHFGGIWEAGVKSTKYHLKRIIGDTKLTFEEMCTLLTQIEAVLNSRPLVEVDNQNSEAIDTLTPGHFLIGRPLIDCPEHIDESKISSLNRWKLIQKLKKDFWNRWKEEYLVTLQQRAKWRQPRENLKKGSVVLVKDESTYPAKWPLGRVVELHEGKDGKVRVVTIKLQNSILKRPIHKVCALPVSDDQKDEEDKLPVTSLCTSIKQPRERNVFRIFGVLLLLFVMMKQVKTAPLESNKPYSIKEISSNTAIYLDNIGQLNMINSKWNLVVYFDLSMYHSEIERIQKLMEKIKNECPNLGYYKEACEMVISTMGRRNNILNENNDLLLTKPRKKRAPFEFVGSLYHMLFGMMDADDRDKMEENMRNVFENQQNLNQLIQEQTSIVDSTINVLKKTTDDVNANFNKMYGQLKLFYEEVQSTKNTERLIILFQVMSTQLNLMIDECSRIQSSIISLLIDINHGHVNPDLLKPSQLQKQLAEIKKMLPNNLVLPGEASGTELKEVYHSMNSKGIIMESRLVIQLEIPLLHVHSSEVYEIIKLPVGSNNHTMIPRIGNNLIIYNFAANMYFLMSLAQLNTCKKNLQGQFDCIGNVPWKPATERSCEVSALKQSMHADCAFEEIPTTSFWKTLSTENHWIFTVFNNFVITIDCGQGNRSWITLPVKGILTLSPGCTATYEGVTLTTSQRFTSSIKSSIKSSSWGLEFQQIESRLVKPLDVTMINNKKEITHLKNSVEQMKAAHIELKRFQSHTASGHASLVLIMVGILILFCIYIKYKCCRSNKTVVKLDFSAPAPLPAAQNVQI